MLARSPHGPPTELCCFASQARQRAAADRVDAGGARIIPCRGAMLRGTGGTAHGGATARPARRKIMLRVARAGRATPKGRAQEGGGAAATAHGYCVRGSRYPPTTTL